VPIEPIDTSIRIACTRCATKTMHSVLMQTDRSGREDVGDDTFYWNDDYQIVECCGCKTVSFRHLHMDSEDYASGPDGGEFLVTQNLYPAREEGRRELSDQIFVPIDVRRVYLETKSAMANNQLVLAGIGVRAIVEAVCRDKEAVGANLKRKIDDLALKGLLSNDGVQILHRLRTMGNRSAHTVVPHTPEQLSLAMDVVEHLLQGAYIFPERAAWTLRDEA